MTVYSTRPVGFEFHVTLLALSQTGEVKCRIQNSQEDSLTSCAWDNDGGRFYIGGTRGQFMECVSSFTSHTSTVCCVSHNVQACHFTKEILTLLTLLSHISSGVPFSLSVNGRYSDCKLGGGQSSRGSHSP